MKSLLLLILLIPLFCFSAKPEKALRGYHKIIYQKNLDRVYGKTATIIWYGVDMSHTRLIEFKRLGQQERFFYYDIPRLLTFFEEHQSDHKIKRHIGGSIIMDAGVTRNLLANEGKHDQAISVRPNTLNFDSIQSIVNTYKTNDSIGIAMTMIVANLVKEDRIGEYYFTFFDNKTKEVLYICRVNGIAAGKTFRKFWGKSLYDGWHNFINYYWWNSAVKREAIATGKITE